jgi:hypothetical protein
MADALEAARAELTEYFGAGQSAAAGLRDLVPVAVSAKPLALQAVVYFPHDVERPIAHLARVPNEVVSGEVDADADQDRAAVRFRTVIGEGGEHCRQRQSYKSRADELHGIPLAGDGLIPHSLTIVQKKHGAWHLIPARAHASESTGAAPRCILSALYVRQLLHGCGYGENLAAACSFRGRPKM